MLISHEVPICLLNKSKKFNDYDYCLLHLIFENKKYKNYYIKASKKGRKVLLDNSIFELGEALDNNLIFEGVRLINPEWVVAPDVLDNCDETISNFDNFKKEFNKEFPNSKTKIIGVVQGSTKEELIKCYKYMSENADKIALSFNCKGYDDYKNELAYKEKMPRVSFIKDLEVLGIWNYNKPHHLLGCYKAEEFANYNYNKLTNLETLDTSNPIIAGMFGYKYGYFGLDFKPKQKLCDFIDYRIEGSLKKLINYNVKQFKNIVKEGYIDE